MMNINFWNESQFGTSGKKLELIYGWDLFSFTTKFCTVSYTRFTVFVMEEMWWEPMRCCQTKH